MAYSTFQNSVPWELQSEDLSRSSDFLKTALAIYAHHQNYRFSGMCQSCPFQRISSNQKEIRWIGRSLRQSCRYIPDANKHTSFPHRLFYQRNKRSSIQNFPNVAVEVIASRTTLKILFILRLIGHRIKLAGRYNVNMGIKEL
jgi:hypothetical protein